jgi:short chain dehydrogenase
MRDDGPNAGVAVVTGASRGAGRGIAIALGAHGYTVYVTGRTQRAGESPWGGTIHDTAAAVTAAGGKGVAVRVDHRDDDAAKALFERVGREHGRLDILVSNAALIREELQSAAPFWEKPLAASVDLLDVGLDKFAADMAVDFRPFGVAAVSILMGAVLTERLRQVIDSGPEFAYLDDIAETPEFTGHVVAALAADPDVLAVSGRTLIGAEVAWQYGITDRDGRHPPSMRELMSVQPVNYQGKTER